MVVLSIGVDGVITLLLGDNYAIKTWRDFLGNRDEYVLSNDQGDATFFCYAGSVSVWVIEDV
ncbi:hypothetical protein AIZ23_24485 [Salmonella enterica subsp. enterica serovar Typhimurium]|nr:hypothetical protein AIZ23_24485 [Salmonella enterica subsp. enterica serovar Typhimurium]